jgi:predicted nuclease of restriction endonuclease-like RecB superfamily
MSLLPSDLLLVWKRKGTILPRYARPSVENLEVATDLIEAYKRCIGEKKKILKDFVSELEAAGYDYRFVRGLSFMLDKRSLFKCDDRIDPVDLRRRIYQATGKTGIPTALQQRSLIIEAVASELKVAPDAVEQAIYADLDEELILEKFESLPAHELLEGYNLSLTQTLLFDSTELNFTTSGNWQRIFYTIKRLGLIYDAYQDGRFWVKIDGPASIFKLTKRYGTAMAKLLPLIVANPEWTVEAKILWKYTNEICNFKIEGWKHRTMLKTNLPTIATESFDSFVEEDFAARFHALKSGWRLKREPEPVLAGKQVIIPDFSLERENIKVYVEIVGFWTTEYLLRKIEKLKKVDANMLVIVNETLSCEKLSSLEKHPRLNIVYYKDRIPLNPIVRYLEEAFQGVRARQASFLKNLSIVFTESIIDYKEFATRIGMSTEAVRTSLIENPPADYILMPNCLIRKEKLQQIGKKIEQQIGQAGQLPLSEAAKIAEAEGVEDATNALEALGYKIVWHGINVEKAVVCSYDDKKG